MSKQGQLIKLNWFCPYAGSTKTYNLNIPETISQSQTHDSSLSTRGWQEKYILRQIHRH